MAEEKKPLIEVKNLKKYFQVGSGKTLHAVDDVSFSLEKGQTLGLVGESGCGKSTVGTVIMRLQDPTSGELLFEGKDIFKCKNRKENLQYCKEMQIVFQDPYSSLNPKKTIRSILSEGYLIHHTVSKKDLNDVLEVRIALENVAIEKACDRMSEEEMSRLWLAAKEFEHTIAEGNLVKLAEADVAFHEIIYQASDNKRLIQVLNNMREQIYRYRVEYLKEGETRDILVKEHEELTKAIRDRDVERAKKLSYQHIENQRTAIMRSIEAENAERARAEKEKSRGHK